MLSGLQMMSVQVQEIGQCQALHQCTCLEAKVEKLACGCPGVAGSLCRLEELGEGVPCKSSTPRCTDVGHLSRIKEHAAALVHYT